MSKSENKNIMFYGKPNDEYLEQFTRVHLEKWIQLRSNGTASESNYTVRIFFLKTKDEKEFRWVGCEISVNFTEVTFESRTLQPDPYEAISSAIQKLKPVIESSRILLDSIQA